jgi:DNA-binding protein YbaB
MGETHELENEMSDEATFLAKMVTQAMNDALQKNQIIMQCNLEDIHNHLSLG